MLDQGDYTMHLLSKKAKRLFLNRGSRQSAELQQLKLPLACQHNSSTVTSVFNFQPLSKKELMSKASKDTAGMCLGKAIIVIQ